jgi:hypothetical protein
MMVVIIYWNANIESVRIRFRHGCVNNNIIIIIMCSTQKVRVICEDTIGDLPDLIIKIPYGESSSNRILCWGEYRGPWNKWCHVSAIAAISTPYIVFAHWSESFNLVASRLLPVNCVSRTSKEWRFNRKLS